MANFTKTTNGGNTYDHSGVHALEMFSKAGSLFANKAGSASSDTTALKLFQDVWRTGDHVTAMKLLFWLRDPRGGAGNRSGFRACLTWLSKEDPTWVQANIALIPKYGRWDDLRSTYHGDNTMHYATMLWAQAILDGDVLAAKWADHKDSRVRKALTLLSDGGYKEIGEHRRLLSKIRKGVVEVAMSQKNFSEINYSHVPSVAMSRYSAAFSRNDSERFLAYKAELEKVLDGDSDAKVKMNAGALFPHDCIRTIRGGDKKTGDLQFRSLPNFMEEGDARVLTIADTSGSMSTPTGGYGSGSNVTCADVSQALALYCSDRLGKDNPFYRKYMQFAREARLTDWKDKNGISDVIDDRKMFDHSIGNTDISLALNTIVKYGTMFSASAEQMPTHLLIVSDMQFDQGVSDNTTATVVENALTAWDDADYPRPHIIYWDVNGAHGGSPAKARTPNTALVSGFSPSILKAIFGNPESMNPINIMHEAIKDYVVVVPKQ